MTKVTQPACKRTGHETLILLFDSAFWKPNTTHLIGILWNSFLYMGEKNWL